MIILIVILHIIVCIFLIAVILLQAGRGQGLSWGVFGGSPQSILGTKTASFLSRVTTACAFIFLFTCISLNIIEVKKSRSLLTSMKTKRPISEVDIAKIKEALEKAAQTKKEEGVAQPTQKAEATKQTGETQSVQTSTASEPPAAQVNLPAPTPQTSESKPSETQTAPATPKTAQQ